MTERVLDTVACKGCGKPMEVENWTYGADYWCSSKCVNPTWTVFASPHTLTEDETVRRVLPDGFTLEFKPDLETWVVRNGPWIHGAGATPFAAASHAFDKLYNVWRVCERRVYERQFEKNSQTPL